MSKNFTGKTFFSTATFLKIAGVMMAIIALSAESMWAQTLRTVTGTVTDSKQEALIGVAVRVVGNETKGAATEFDGTYTLNEVTVGSQLKFTYTGYKELLITVGSTGNIDAVLEEAVNQLDAVNIVAGRAAQRTLDAPAAVSVLQPKDIKNIISATPADYLANASGVDLVRTGLTGSNVVIRGFNNIFSGAVLSLVDYRIASVPSLRVNAQQMIPSSPFDIDKIEVLKGPASAMYGPNSANGVVHIITKSPLDMPYNFSTSVSAGVGMRSKVSGALPDGDLNPTKAPLYDDGNKLAMMYNLRHAGTLTGKTAKVKVGYKLSGKYFTGTDWKYNDPEERGITLSPDKVRIEGVDPSDYANKILLNKQTANGPVYGDTIGKTQIVNSAGDTVIVPLLKGEVVNNTRDTDIKNYNFDARVDFRFPGKKELVLAGGQNSFSGIEMTGLGAGQGKNWRYNYAQARFSWGNLFAQVYMNTSNAGETYLFRSGNKIIDKSKFYSAQIQHSSNLIDNRLKLIYGIDALLTRPNTGNTINGRNEDNDNIDEVGAYAQADFALSEKINLVGALRADKHTFVKDVFLSPRAAIVYKPTKTQSLRLTYNRAFSSPSPLNMSLDILSGTLPTLIDVRGSGNRNGINFSYDDAGLPQYRLSKLFTNDPSQFHNLGSNSVTNSVYEFVLGRLATGFKEIIEERGLGNVVTPETVDAIVANVIPHNLEGINHLLKDFTTIASNPFGPTRDPKTVKNLAPVRNSVTSTIEAGYKGIIKDKFAVTLDVYQTRITDFVSPLRVETPNVFLDPTTLANVIGTGITANGAKPENAFYTFILNSFLDTAQVVQGIQIDGNSNGNGLEELTTLLVKANAQVPFGTVTPTSTNDPSILLTYKNFGDVTLYGAEFGLNYYANENLKLGGTVAWVSDEEFETEGQVIALNAPQYKAGLTANWSLPKPGLDVGVRYRWQDAFPVNSGVYVGTVQAMNIIDLNLGYTLPFSKNTQLALSIQNLLDNQVAQFVGAPQIGRFTMFQISHTFNNGKK